MDGIPHLDRRTDLAVTLRLTLLSLGGGAGSEAVLLCASEIKQRSAYNRSRDATGASDLPSKEAAMNFTELPVPACLLSFWSVRG